MKYLPSSAALIHAVQEQPFQHRLQDCFRHLKVSPIFGHANIVMVLIVHLLLGYRRLQEVRYYADDTDLGPGAVILRQTYGITPASCLRGRAAGR